MRRADHVKQVLINIYNLTRMQLIGIVYELSL